MSNDESTDDLSATGGCRALVAAIAALAVVGLVVILVVVLAPHEQRSATRRGATTNAQRASQVGDITPGRCIEGHIGSVSVRRLKIIPRGDKRRRTFLIPGDLVAELDIPHVRSHASMRLPLRVYYSSWKGDDWLLWHEDAASPGEPASEPIEGVACTG